MRLTQESFCIDAGNNAAVPAWIETDLDGNLRIFGVVDMGPYELQPSCSELLVQAEQLLALAEQQSAIAEKGDVNFDGIVDILDLAILAANWLEGSE